MSTLTAIQTQYAGCLFRSRIEARWATFFDALRIPWEYEPQGFELPDGGRYLPDFWLPQQQDWYEIKGANPSQAEQDRVQAFAAGLDFREHRIKVAVGMPDPRTDFEGLASQFIWNTEPGTPQEKVSGWNNWVWWARSADERCGSFWRREYWQQCSNGHLTTRFPGSCALCEEPATVTREIRAALAKARSARFEHDQRETW